MKEKIELNNIFLQKTSDVASEEYIVEGLDDKENVLFLVIGSEENKRIYLEFSVDLVNYKLDYIFFKNKVEEAKEIVFKYLNQL
jgi:hypothetical protein